MVVVVDSGQQTSNISHTCSLNCCFVCFSITTSVDWLTNLNLHHDHRVDGHHCNDRLLACLFTCLLVQVVCNRKSLSVRTTISRASYKQTTNQPTDQQTDRPTDRPPDRTKTKYRRHQLWNCNNTIPLHIGEVVSFHHIHTSPYDYINTVCICLFAYGKLLSDYHPIDTNNRSQVSLSFTFSKFFFYVCELTPPTGESKRVSPHE